MGGSVDYPAIVSLVALDQYGNRATNESRTVTLSSNGSTTGLGFVSFSQGVAVRLIRDSIPEFVQLWLEDPYFGWNVSSQSQIRFYAGKG